MQQKTKVFDYIDKNQEKIVDFLKDLICYPSINPGDGIHGEEGPVQDYLIKRLKEDSFDSVKEFAFDAEGVRKNVVGVRQGNGSGRSLAFFGHCDVVPVAFPERWVCDPFNPEEIDGKLYGRGSSDMKGGLAGAYYAIKTIKDCGIKLCGDVLFISSVGEESQSAETLGIEKVIKSGIKTDFAICCEPSDLEIHTASSALLFFRLTIEGKGVHVSARNQMLFPQAGGIPSGNEVGVDAFRKSLPIIDYLSRLEIEWNHRFRDPVMGWGGKPTHDKQGVGVFTMNPSYIKGGEYLGTVPSRMEYTYAVWYPDRLISRDELIKEIKEGVSAIASTDSWLKEHPPIVEAPVIQDWPGFWLDENNTGVNVLSESIKNATGKNAVISGFKAVCDAYYTNRQGVPTVVLGPGSIFNSVHGDNEFIKIEDLIEATKIYAAFAMDWCGMDE